MREERSLDEIIGVVLRRKWLIISVVFLTMLVTGTINFFNYSSLPVNYEGKVSMLLDNRFINAHQFSLNKIKETIENPLNLESVFRELKLQESGLTENSFKGSVYVNVEEDKKIVNIFFTGTNTELVELVMNKLGQNGFSQFMSLLEEDIDYSEGIIADVEKELDNIQKNPEHIALADNNMNPLYYNLAMKWSEHKMLLIRLNHEKEYLGDPKNQAIFIKKGSISNRVIASNSTKAVIEAGLTAFIISIFVAFFLEYWRKYKNKPSN